MIIDVNACLGHYPFRALLHNTAQGMVALMDRNGIDRALVSSLHGVFYRDVQRANEELLAQIAPYRTRFISVGTINPKYPGWERDLAELVEKHRVKAITLVPEHHGYALTDEHGRAALQRIASHGVPVLLTQRFEDRRQRHHWDRVDDLPVRTLLEVARAHPQLRFILANWIGLPGPALVDAGLKGRCLIDIARIQVVYRKEVPRLIESLGVEAIAFGSHMPFDYVGPSLVKLASIEQLRPAEFEAIAWRNAATFLGLQ